jgi:hypothetical protein
MTAPHSKQSRSLTLLLAVALALAFACATSAAQRQAVPAKEAQERAAKLIDELYRDDITASKRDRDARLKLARIFLLEARDTGDDPAGKYVLLRESADLAARAGDGAIALQAIGEMAQAFDIPASSVLRLKIQALQTAGSGSGTPESYQGTVDAALALMEEALAVDDLEIAADLGATAEAAARKLKNVALVSSIRKRNEEIKTLQGEFAEVKPFVDALQKSPADPRANLEAGKYFAIVKGHWAKGLPLLGKGSDAKLKAVAALELSLPSAARDQARLGNMWADAAGQFKDLARINVLLRAYHWYQEALAESEGPERAAVDTKMTALNDQLPSEYRAGEIATELRKFHAHSGPVFGVSLSADANRLVTCGADALLRLWDPRKPKELRRFEGHGGPVWCVALAPGGGQIVSGGFDRSIRLWDPVTGLETRRLGAHEDYVRSVAYSRDGRFVLSGGDDRAALLWDLQASGQPKALRGHDHFIFGVAIARKGPHALTASLDKTARYWDLETGESLRVLAGHTDTVLTAALTPDGRLALTGSTDKTLRLWDLATGQTLHVLRGHAGYVTCTAILPDGRRALSGGQDGKLLLWDLQNGKLVREMECGGGAIWSVCCSADGRFAATGSNDGTARLWGNR